MRTRRSRQAGFTLIEMMVVVSIIAIATAIAVPSISGALADQRAAQAAVTMVRIGRQARNTAIGTGRAQLVQIRAGAETVALVPGHVSGCNQNNWGAVTDVEASMNLVMDTYYNRGHETIEIEGDAMAELDICYQPNGVVFMRVANGGRFREGNAAGVNGGITFRVVRKTGGTAVGVARQVLFPLGAAPRLRV